MRSLLLPLAFLAPFASAQTVSDGISGDARFLTFNYSDGGIFHLPTSLDAVQTILFGQGETIRSVILSDPSAYTVGVSGKGDSLILRPKRPSSLAMMSVRTEVRSYEIELVAVGDRETPAVVRFSYGTPKPPLPETAKATVQAKGFVYRLSGSAALRPASISDDGSKTYLAWERDQALPAVFVIGASGKEEMVDGYMRGGFFTIDRVHEQLIFRMDRERATARRMRKRDRDGSN